MLRRLVGTPAGEARREPVGVRFARPRLPGAGEGDSVRSLCAGLDRNQAHHDFDALRSSASRWRSSRRFSNAPRYRS